MTTTEGIDSAGTANLAFLEELFAQYQYDPESLSADWRQYFDSLQKFSSSKLANGHYAEKHRASTDDQLLKSQHNGTTVNSSVEPSDGSVVHAEQRNGLLENDTMILRTALRQVMLLRLPKATCSCRMLLPGK